jgi:type VI secretion system protein ImpA
MAGLPEGFDLDALLAPIPGEAPVGVDLREDFSPQSPYYRLRDARAEARAAERIADAADAEANQDAVTPPQWRTVSEVAQRALAEQTKDLEIAAWLTEALLRSDGLPGLTAGAMLITGLASFWDDGVFPLPDEDGVVTRLAPIIGLNGEGADGTLVQPLRRVPLFQRPDGVAYALWQYEQSQEVEGIGDAARKQQRLAAGTVPFADMEQAARTTGAARLSALRAQAGAALAAWTAMGEALDARAGADGPPTGRIRDILQSMVAAIGKYAPAEELEAPTASGDGDAAEPVPGQPGGTSPARAVTREDMLRELLRIADFFKRNEPHSPLAATLEEAARRARLSYAELLEELVPDVSARHAILTSLGIKPPGDDGG